MKTTVLSLLLLVGTLAWGNERKLSPDLRGQHSTAAVDVIVQFKVSPVQKHRDRIVVHGRRCEAAPGTVIGNRAVNVAHGRAHEIRAPHRDET